jgi:hypothetical protein
MQNFYLGAQLGFPLQVLAPARKMHTPSCGLFIAIPGAILQRNAFLQNLACPFTQWRRLTFYLVNQENWSMAYQY